jgi:GDP-L-fucose synthase
MTANMMIKHFNQQYGTNYLTVNFCNLYGNNDCWDNTRNHVIPALIDKYHKAKINNDKQVTVYGTGESRREFLHADDAARALLI